MVGSVLAVDLLGPAPGTCPDGSASVEEVPPDSEPGRIWNVPCTGSDGEGRYLPPQDARGITASYTWDDFGVTGDVRRAALGQPLAFAAAPGAITFQRVDLPVGGLQGAQLALHGDDEGFLLVVPGSTATGVSPEATVLTSGDGRSWSEPSALPGNLSWVQAAGRVGGTFVLLGSTGDGESAVVINSAGGWSTVPLSDLLGLDGPGPQVMRATVGPDGVVATLP